MTHKLLTWYNHNKRDLPWRRDGGIYAVLVSEMMLQQTTVDTVLRYYDRFIAHFPDIHALADASEEEVLNIWQGLGYYARARRLHRIAQQIAEHGLFPQTYEEWLSLKGVGPYMAGAVMSIAFGKPFAAVDGNVMRVIARIYALDGNIESQPVRKEVTARVRALVPNSGAGDFTQALMELGALVCRPVSPACICCPLAHDCQAHKKGIVTQIPAKKPRARQRNVSLFVAVIEAKGCIALEFRRDQKLLSRMWGLPLVEKAAGKTPEMLFAHKYGVHLSRGQPDGHTVHVFTHLRWEMDILRYKMDQCDECAGWEWTSCEQLSEKPIPAAFRKVLEAVSKGDIK